MSISANRSRIFEVCTVAALTLIGLAIRLWAARTAPGLWYDEAIYALDSLDVARKPGYWPIFFETFGHMREPMFMYIHAIPLRLFGPSVLLVRSVDAIIGAATIPIVHLLAREFFFGTPLSREASQPANPIHPSSFILLPFPFILLPTTLFTFLFWHIHFSGLMFRTILSPLFCALTLLFFLRLLRTASRRDAILCGAALGLGAYTYLSFRLMPFILAVPMIAALIGSIPQSRPAMLRNFATLIGVALIIFAPLGIDFVRHPDHFSGRGEEVNLFERPDWPSLLAQQARDVGLMPLLRGDHEPKHNVPGLPQFSQVLQPARTRVAELWGVENDTGRAQNREAMDPHGTGSPVFDSLNGILFYLGFFILAIRSWRDARSLTIISTLLIGSLASVLSFGAPNMLRLLFITPAVVIALAAGYELILRQFAPPRFPRFISCILLAVGLCAFIWREIRLTRIWPTHPMVIAHFNEELVDVADYLHAQPDKLPVLLPFDSQPTITFLADGYRFNLPDDQLGDRWWEFRTVSPPFPPLTPKGVPIPEGRTHRVMHPQGIIMGDLVEVGRP
ncbi:hypothetical protein BH09SUM1_BH09SUM1_04880 [soil metagenome]